MKKQQFTMTVTIRAFSVVDRLVKDITSLANAGQRSVEQQRSGGVQVLLGGGLGPGRHAETQNNEGHQ
jgi:hypothetical protein